MPRGLILLRNALAGRRRPLGPEAFLAVWTTAVQAGRLGDAERAMLADLRLRPDAEPLREALMRACAPDADAPNPEVAACRRADPHFDRKVAAVAGLVRPGDLLFWRSAETRFPWGVMRRAYGPWMHVSMVLADGRLLDPYWPEGTTISTIEAAIAKSARRIRASELLLTRPATPLAGAALEAVTARSYADVGRPYGLLGVPGRPSPSASCARAVWEYHHAHGVDLTGDRPRLFHTTVTPRDTLQPAYALVRADGSVEHDPTPETEPSQGIGRLARFLEGIAVHRLGLERFVLMLGPFLTWLFMETMLPRPIAPPEPEGEAPPLERFRTADRG